MTQEAYKIYYKKRQDHAKLLNIPVTKVKLGFPENICECPHCERRRRIGNNASRRRRNSKLPQAAPLVQLEIKYGCPCVACVKRREERKLQYARKQNRTTEKISSTLVLPVT